jgi:hypothetical protein
VPISLHGSGRFGAGYTEARRKIAAEGGLGMQLLSSGDQDSFRLDNVGVWYTAVYRTHRRTRFMVVEAYTLSTFFRNNVENPVGNWGMLNAV